MICLVTYGCPAMVSKNTGLEGLLTQDNLGSTCNPIYNFKLFKSLLVMQLYFSDLVCYHCIIHSAVLTTKLSGELSGILEKPVKLVNYLRSTSHLQRRLLRSFLEESEAQYTDLLLHNDVCWLSKGRTLSRLWLVRLEIVEFLKQSSRKGSDDYAQFLDDTKIQFSFLVDIFHHLNDLNLKFQGKSSSIFELLHHATVFQSRLQLFRNDLNNRDFSHFETMMKLKSSGELDDSDDLSICAEFLSKLSDNMDSRFENATKQTKSVRKLLTDPFNIDVRGEWRDDINKLVPTCNVKLLQCQSLTDIQHDDKLKNLHAQTKDKTDFFVGLSQEVYPNLRSTALVLLTLMGSTWICESGFSKMAFIKSKFRSQLSQEHLTGILRSAVTTFKPSFSHIGEKNKKTSLFTLTLHCACS